MWGLQATTCVYIVTSCETLTSNMLKACTCTLSTFEINEDGIWVGVDDIWTREVDGVSLSTPPTLSR